MKEGNINLPYYKDSRDKMLAYSFCMTILIVMYHLAPHLIDLIEIKVKYKYCQNFFELFGSIALNYFFAASAYKFFVSSKTVKEKLYNRIRTLIIPFLAWNTLYISIHILQKGTISAKTLVLGYTLSPFDGPLWYIFVLYLFFIIFGNRNNYKCNKTFFGVIILLSIVFAAFHFCIVKQIFDFPYAFWLERTGRMVPPFLVGACMAREHKPSSCISKAVIVFSVIGSIMCILLSTYIGDGAFTILLMYLCTFLLWIACPNFKLKNSSIMRQDTFSIYAVHEGVIIIVLALIYKMKLHVNSLVSITLIMMVVLFIIFELGLIINKCLKKVPAFFDIVLTGGRNIR